MFSVHGAILSDPVQVESDQNGKVHVEIKFYKLDDGYTYTLLAKFANRAFSRFPHENEPLFQNIADARAASREVLRKWCFENQLKKQFYQVMCVSQPELFDYEGV